MNTKNETPAGGDAVCWIDLASLKLLKLGAHASVTPYASGDALPLVLSDALAAATAKRDALTLLQTPEGVHVNMLAGKIAKISMAQCAHTHGAPAGDAADVARLTAQRDNLAAQVEATEDREALLAGSEESIPLKPASAHGLEGNAAAAYEQCRVMMALCTLLSIHYRCGAFAIAERRHPVTVEGVGQSSAWFMESIGDHLNDCDMASDCMDWATPIYDKAQEIWPGEVEAMDALAAPAGDTAMPVVAWQVLWTATPNEPGNANPWTALTPAEYRPNPSRDEVELVRKPDAVAALAGRDVVIASLQKFNRDEHAAWDMQLGVISAEIARLTQCLAGANSQAEEFERKWYLRGHELEGLTVERDAAIAARDSAVKLVDSLNAQLAASRVPATEIEIERAVNPSALYAGDWDEVVWRAAEKHHGIT